MIVAFVNLKGGAGKTTSAMHFAQAARLAGHNVTVLDTDPEASAFAWDSKNVRRIGLDELATIEAADGEVIVIDTPPNSREALIAVAVIADAVIVPVIPSGVDVNRLGSTLVLLNRINIKPHVLLTQWDSRRILSNEAEELLADYVLDTKISMREAYRRAFGGTPSFMAEFNSLFDEIERKVSNE